MATQQTKLKPSEEQWFRTQQRRADQAWQMGGQQLDYERSMANQQAAWDRADLAKAYSRQRETFANPWNRRGMMNSGGYQAALARMITDHNENVGRMAVGDQYRNQGFGLAETQLQQVHDSATADLADQRRAYEQTIASMLRTYGAAG